MKEVNIGKYWPYWGLHFGSHLLIGIVAAIAGIVVIVKTSQIINGLALVGAGAFAIINGWSNLQELVTDKMNKFEMNCKEDSR